ncbi:unnamed protein product [Rotaria magnacalcarata]|uniref:Immunoglobulin domain-containing protein n=2 Tax=Rotaria magnacalcarata TaxID=392030 RepID=A0A816UJA0_9BILA|nr:unnamed protein product [Rotaria magnacalcarata]CAF2114838.1 unnamed protein product [Rotaria magnacalcarata]
MSMIYACLCLLHIVFVTAQNDDLLLNGSKFPSSIYIPIDESYLLKCNSENIVYWKLYLKNGRIEFVNDKLIRLEEFNKNRDGFYQCYTNDESSQSRGVFIFSNGARSIDRTWTKLTEFHENLVTSCRPMHFNYGFNEQFIELIDTKQTIRYNRSVLLIKHIRSTTHLFCKLYMDTTCVGIRVQTLIGKNLDSSLLSDEYLKTNDYISMNTNERDTHRIAFEGDSVYFHCPSNESSSIQWNFLSANYYAMITLTILYDQDTKIQSVTRADAGLYTCQTENTIYQRIVLTIIHPPKPPDNIYTRTYNANLYSKYLICCHLDAFPYPTYSWSMITEFQNTSLVWCSKRCCWLHIIYRSYQNIICTSTNQIGMAKYSIHLNVQDTDSHSTIVYDETEFHTDTDKFTVIRNTTEYQSIVTMEEKTLISDEKTTITINENAETATTFLDSVLSSSHDSDINTTDKTLLNEVIP